MKVSDQDQKRIRDYYEDHLKKHGIYDPQALSWSSQEAQLIRFQALLGIGDLEGKSILDVGCGLGDFYQFLKLNFDRFSYLGIDLVPKLVEKAKIKYPRAKFKSWDIMEFPQKTFDYVLASGIFSFKVANHKKIYFEMIKKIYSLSRQATGFNMLDKEGHIDNELFAAYNSGQILDFCRSLSPKAKLINDYSPQDFTIFLYH
ncbi:MAG TPA: methyltransferase domain-containing protein [Clostridia bacterium]|nr:methyltransferase domain-containing protein [Clostridia bacterium]